MLYAIAASGKIENVRLFFPAIGRNNGCYRKTDDLFRSVTVEVLGAFVPARNDAAQVGAQDRVVARFDDGGKALCRFDAALSLRNVMGDADEQARPLDPGFAD